jgi:large subunit ribosomal protein L4
MQFDLFNLKNENIGQIELSEEVFFGPVRQDILARVVLWQLAKRRAGTHCAKNISAVQGTTKKPWKQKGTGRARQGSLRSVQFRKGAVAHGPVPRSHEHSLQKKVRQFGMRSAIASKRESGNLIILDSLNIDNRKTKDMLATLQNMGLQSALFIDGQAVNESFKSAISNIKNIDVLPSIGANVYDILRREKLVLTKEAVENLEARLK